MTRQGTTILRRAVEADLDAVLIIERAAFTDPPWSRDSFVSLVASPHAYFTVACDPDVIGYVVAWFVVDEVEIANLAVDPAHRVRGVGAQLLDAALTEAGL